MSSFVDNSHAKNDGGEENLSSSPDAFSVPEKARSSAERARRRRHGTPPNAEKQWYSKTEAASYLGVAEITITRYLQKGILHAQRLPTPGRAPRAPESNSYNYGRLRIERSELDRYLESVDRKAKDSGRHLPAATSTDEGAGVRSQYGDNSEVMTREEAALWLGVSWRTIKRYIESGKLRLAGYFKCIDSYTRAHVYRSEVEALISRANLVERG